MGNSRFFWRSGNTAEVDFIYEDGGELTPVEVKAADNTQAKSYRQFCKKYRPQKGIKLSEKNLGENLCESTATDGRLAGRVRLCGVHAAVAQAAVVADKAFVAEIAAVF